MASAANSEVCKPVIEQTIKRHERSALLMFLILLLSSIVNAMDRQLFPVLAVDIRRDYHFSLSDIGLLSTIFTLGMALAGVAAGQFLNLVGRKALLQLGIFIYSACTALTVVSFGFGDMLLYRSATGIGEAMQLTVLLAIAAACFPRWRALAIGAINVCFAIGATIGPVIGSILLTRSTNWRVPMLLFSVLGFLAMVIIQFAVKRSMTDTNEAMRSHIVGGSTATLLNRNTVLLTAMSCIAGIIIYGFLGMYPTFLREALSYTPYAASVAASCYGLGALTSVLTGWFGDRFSSRLVLGAGVLGTALTSYCIFHSARAFGLQCGLTCAFGIFASGTLYVNLAGYQVKAVDQVHADRASGLFVTSLYSSATVAGFLMGRLAERIGWTVAGETLLGAFSLLGLMLALCLDTTRIGSSHRGLQANALMKR